MANVTVQSRVNPELKAQAEEIFSAIGISTSDAIRMFLQQSVNIGGLPFLPRAKTPNPVTLAAIESAKNNETVRYENAEALFDDLEI